VIRAAQLQRRRRRRRVVVQLAALVDLLFVVMFLQFTELQRAAGRVNAERKQADVLKEGVLADQSRLRRERDDLALKLEDMQGRLAEAERGRAEIQARTQADLSAVADAARAVLVGVDPKAVAEQLRGAPEEKRRALVEQLKTAQGKNTTQVIQLLRKSDELQKRCDVWEVHLFADGQVRVRGPGVAERRFSPRNADDFSNRFMEAATEAGSPKDLVLILFTHGNAELGTLEFVRRGLEQVRTVWRGQLPAHKSVQITAPAYSEDAP